MSHVIELVCVVTCTVVWLRGVASDGFIVFPLKCVGVEDLIILDVPTI